MTFCDDMRALVEGSLRNRDRAHADRHDAVMARLDRIEAMLAKTLTNEERTMSVTSDILAAIAAETNPVQAGTLALNALSQENADLKAKLDSSISGADVVSIQNALHDLAAKTVAMAAAIPAGSAVPEIVPVVPVTQVQADTVPAADSVNGASSNDSINSASGNDTLTGSDGNDSSASSRSKK